MAAPENFPIQKAYAATSLGPIHYAEAGEGPPLILLSETPRSHRHFNRAKPVLARHFRTFVIDTPGFGYSRPLPDPVTIPALASCVVAFLDALGLEKAHVFGVNTGNKIAAALASEWPGRVGDVVLAGYTHSIIPNWAARNAAIQPLFDRSDFQFGPSPDGSHLVRQWLAAHAAASTIWWPPTLLTGTDIAPSDIENAEAQVADYVLGWQSIVPVYRAVFAFDLARAFVAIRARTLVLELRSTQEEPLGPQAELVCALMPSATPASLDVTYLYAMQAQAESIAAITTSFLLP